MRSTQLYRGRDWIFRKLFPKFCFLLWKYTASIIVHKRDLFPSPQLRVCLREAVLRKSKNNPEDGNEVKKSKLQTQNVQNSICHFFPLPFFPIWLLHRVYPSNRPGCKKSQNKLLGSYTSESQNTCLPLVSSISMT